MPAASRTTLALLLGLASLACGDGSPVANETTSRSTEDGERGQDGPEDLAPVDPSNGRGPALEGAAPAADADASIELDRNRPIVGRVVVDGPVPPGEPAWLVVEVPDVAGDEDARELARSLFYFEQSTALEAARVPLRPDLTFEAPRPVGGGPVRLRAEGAWLLGDGLYLADMPDGPVEVAAVLGARARLRLDLHEIATEAEIAALEGRSVTVQEVWHGVSTGRRPTRRVEVDDRGWAAVPLLSAGTWSIERPRSEEERDSLAPFCVEPGFEFTVPAGEVSTIDVPMIRGRRLAARVVSEDGSPIADASILATVVTTAGLRTQRRTAHRVSDAEGWFSFAALESEPESVVLKAEGHTTRRLGTDDVEALLDVEDATIVMATGAALRLRVRTSAGLPAQGLQVSVVPDGAEDDPLVAWTDEDGTAIFSPLPAGGARVSTAALEGPGPRDDSPSVEGVARFHPPSTIATDASAGPLWCLNEQVSSADIGAAEITLTLVRAPALTGQVRGIAPDWPDPVLVLVRPEPSGATPRQADFRTIPNVGLRVDRATSSFSGQVAPGAYEAVATSGRGEGADIRLSDARIHASGVVPFTAVDGPVELELAFTGSAPIVGRVEEPDGTPVPGVEVTLVSRDARMGRSTASSDRDGSFRVAPLRPGRYSAHVADQRFVMEERSEFIVAADRATPDVVVVVTRAGAARVTVLGPDGVPRERPLVDIHRVGGRRATVDPAPEDSPWPGAYGPLSPGRYVAAAHAGRSIPFGERDMVGGPVGKPKPRSPDLIHVSGFEVVAGEITEVVIREAEGPVAEITGRIEVGGSPSGGEPVWLARDDAMLAMAISDDAGRFTIPVGFTGPASLYVHGIRGHAAAALELVITEGPNPLGAIDLPTGRVLGRVPADLRPAEGAVAYPAAFTPGGDEPIRYSGGVADGRFVIQHLPDGDYVIGFPILSGGVDAGVQVTVENGETVRDVVLGSSER